MAFQWTSRDWVTGSVPSEGKGSSADAEPLRAVDLINMRAVANRKEATVPGYVHYADLSYLSCRIVMLSSETLGWDGLYLAGQVLEKYMKALLLQRDGNIPNLNHHLQKYAKRLGEEFRDPEFLDLCKLLEPFEMAGRYPDHFVRRGDYSLRLLTFLDGFVTHCRGLLGMAELTSSAVGAFLEEQPDNPVMQGARIAVRDNNHYLPQRA